MYITFYGIYWIKNINVEEIISFRKLRYPFSVILYVENVLFSCLEYLWCVELMLIEA